MVTLPLQGGLWQQINKSQKTMNIEIKKRRLSKRLPELLDKELINSVQSDTLNMMIESSDPENFTVAESLVKSLIRTKLSYGLNVGQTQAFESMIDFLEYPEHHAVVLKGYAGTGKTYLVKKVLEYIIATTYNEKVAITAPTNKAVSVLYKGALENEKSQLFEDIYKSDVRITYSTIHKLLGLKEMISDNGIQSFVVEKANMSDLSNYSYLVVDEISMLDDKLCKDILGFMPNSGSQLKIIFMGDPAQIPPINKTDSIPFSSSKTHLYNFKHIELTEIMRQKGDHPIIDASFKIRNNLKRPQPLPVLATNLNSNDNGIVYLNSKTDKHKIKDLLKQYFVSADYRKSKDYFKVIAWRNKTIDYINNIARELMYGEEHHKSRFIVGESLIVVKPIFEKKDIESKYFSVVLTTSEELQVQKITLLDYTFREGPYKLKVKIYNLKVTSFDPEDPANPFVNTIKVIHEDDMAQYEALVEKTAAYAKRTKQGKDWVTYFNILKWSANVGYNYAITAHKSQGSTYENVLILEEDIDQNKNVVERNRIKYTVYSRASNKLFVLRDNFPELVYNDKD